jgi:hypothetical protein
MMLTFSEVRKREKEDATELPSMRVRTSLPWIGYVTVAFYTCSLSLSIFGWNMYLQHI